MGHDGIYDSTPKPKPIRCIQTMNEDSIAWGEIGLAADAVLQARHERDCKKIHRAVDRLNEAYMLLLRYNHFVKKVDTGEFYYASQVVDDEIAVELTSPALRLASDYRTFELNHEPIAGSVVVSIAPNTHINECEAIGGCLVRIRSSLLGSYNNSDLRFSYEYNDS